MIGMEEITKEQFEAYDKVRKSGATNMFNIANVEMLSGLEKEVIKTIMLRYGDLKNFFQIKD